MKEGGERRPSFCSCREKSLRTRRCGFEGGKEVSLNMQMEVRMDAGLFAPGTPPSSLPTFFIICPISVVVVGPLLLPVPLPAAAPPFLPFLVFLARGLFGFSLVLYKMRQLFCTKYKITRKAKNATKKAPEILSET